MASTELTRTTSSTDTGTKFTLSVWLKRATPGTNNKIYHATNDSNTNSYIDYTIASNDRLDFQIKNGSGTTFIRRRTNRVFRDTSAWYHLVARYDSTQSTASDRIRLYVNGELETSIDQDGTPDCPLNYTSQLALNSVPQNIGNIVSGSDQFFSGIMSHYHLCVGYSYAPTEFGETDSATGEWKIKTSPSVSYGNNGFLILKDGNTITDQSPNSNNWTLAGGTVSDTKDNPSNVFATINPLNLYSHGGQKAVLEYGNLAVDGSTGGTVNWYGASTLGFDKGKFYWEIKNDTSSNTSLSVGVSTDPSRNQYEDQACGARASDIATENYSGNIVINNSNVSVGYGSTWTGSGDVCMIAVDADNGKFYIGKDGVWADSDNPSTNTGGYSMSTVTNVSGYYFPAFGSTSSTYMNGFSVNFGGGSFGDTAISSAGTNASGNGVFEYDCPTNFTALSTKGLNI